MPLKTFLKNIFIIFLTLLATLPVIAQDNLLSKFGNKLSYAKYNLQCENPQWLGDISEAAGLALELAKTKGDYKGITYVGSFLLSVKDYKNALTFLKLAAENKEIFAWCEIARTHFQGIGVPQDIKKGNKIFEKGLEHCKGFIRAGEGLNVEQMQGFYKRPIDYGISSLPNPRGILKNFEDCGYTFNIKESKEYLFMKEKKDDFEDLGRYLPITLSQEQLENSKDRPHLIPEAHIVRLFSDYKEDGSDIEQLVDIDTIKKKLKVLSREAGNSSLFFYVDETEEVKNQEYYYKYLGGLSNGLQFVYCVYYHGGSMPALRLAAFQAKKTAGAEPEIDIAYMVRPYDRPYTPYFYIEDDTLVEVLYDYSIIFHTLLPEDEFRKTKLPVMLKKIEEQRKTEIFEPDWRNSPCFYYPL